MSYADDLQEIIVEADAWPIPAESEIHNEIAEYQAWRDADAPRLKPRGWSEGYKNGRDYIVDPLAGRISGAKADLLFGEKPGFEAAEENDQDNLDGIIAQNHLGSRLQTSEDICASEGEVWWRGYVDPALSYPAVDWLSRLDTLPLYVGPELVAVAFVTPLDSIAGTKDRFHWVEIQERGYVRNLLFQGTETGEKLGDIVSLETHPDTTFLPEDWTHGLDLILAGRIVNREGRKPADCGISDYARVTGLLSALNEAVNIGVENARLTGKKRATVPRRFLDEDGNFPMGAEILVETQTDANPDAVKSTVSMIEFEFDAAALIAWWGALEDKVLTRTRTAPQLVGKNTEGAQTGPALRARLLDSVLDATGKGQHWDAELPNCLLALQRLDALPTDNGGLGQSWVAADVAPSVERKSVLPEDETEVTNRVAQGVGALLLSRKTAIKELHPDWSEDQVDAELKQIDAENPASEVTI